MSFLKTIAKLNNSQNDEVLMNELGIYMFSVENQCGFIFKKTDSNLNLGDLSKALEKVGSVNDQQALNLLEHSIKLKAQEAVKLFTLLQEKISLKKYLPITNGLLKERLEFYLKVKNWQSLYKDSGPPLSKIVSKQQHTIVFR